MKDNFSKELFTNCSCYSFAHCLRWSYLLANPSIKDDENLKL